MALALAPTSVSQEPPVEFALPLVPANLKRRRTPSRCESWSSSSDPPMFSSDGSDLGVEYTETGPRRIKRTYKGPWWMGSKPKKPLPTKRQLQRNFDSGVFMGSDNTADSDDLEEGSLLKPSKARQADADLGIGAGQRPLYDDLQQKLAELDQIPGKEELSQIVQCQQRAIDEINEAVDEGNPSIRLTDLRLRVLLDSTIQPLHTLINYRPGEALATPLRLFLGNNELEALPQGLYALEQLIELSVRGNQIKWLAPQIGQLPILTLNVGANQLRYLPYGALRLFHNALRQMESISEFLLARFNLHPNPFVEPVARDPDCITPRVPLPQYAPVLAARSVPCYLNIEGHPLRPSAPWPSQHDSLLHPANVPFEQPSQRSHVPSLFELTLRSAKASRSSSYLLTYLDLPPAVESGLQAIEQIKLAGPIPCDVCGKEYIVPRGEWFEWWAGLRDNEHELVPLLRRVCSWACVGSEFDPKKSDAEKEKEKEEAATDKDEDDKDDGTPPRLDNWLFCGWRPAE